MNKFLKAGAVLLIFLNLLPAGFVLGTVEVNHFFSSVHMFEYVFQHGFQFGTDFVDNVGPYGYLHYPYIYAGGAFWSKMLWFALVCFVYAYYAVVLTGRIRTLPEKFLAFFVVIYFPFQASFPFLSYEIIPRLALLFSALYFLTGTCEKSGWQDRLHIIFNALFYAFLTLEKASNVYFIGLLIAVLFVYWLSRSRWQNGLILFGSYLFGLTVFWFAAGQHQLSGLFDYFASMSSFINAYEENLGTETGDRIFVYGLFYCAVVLVFIGARLYFSIQGARLRNGVPEEVFRSLLVAALCFLAWKHGIFRGIQSFGTFMYTMPILFAYLCFYPITVSDERQARTYPKWWANWWLIGIRSFVFVVLLLVVWSNIISASWATFPSPENSYKVNLFSGIWGEFRNHYSALTSYDPSQSLRDLDEKLGRLRQDNSLPPILKQSMKSGTVDEFGSVPEILLLNDLDYRPRPVPITFIASNAALNDKNGRYYHSLSTAPDFVLLDGDFGFRIADSSVYLSLLFNYQAVNAFQNWLVLNKRTSTWQDIELQELQKNTARMGEWIPISALQQQFLWLAVEAEPSFEGKLKRFFYKPDYVRLRILLEDGSVRNMSVSLAQLRAGFLLNPFFKTKNESFISAKDSVNMPWYLVKAFRIDAAVPGREWLFKPEYKVRLSAVTSAPASGGVKQVVDLQKAAAEIDLVAKNFPVEITHFPIDLLAPQPREDFVVSGMSGVESNGKESWRWATGAETRIKFYVDPTLPEAARQYLLKFSIKNGASIPNQGLTVRLNGKDITYFPPNEIDKHLQFDVEVGLAAAAGVNVLEFAYQDWNHGKKDYSPDSRRLAMVFTHLSMNAYPARLRFPKQSSLLKVSTVDAIKAKVVEPKTSPPAVSVLSLPADLLVEGRAAGIETQGLSGLESKVSTIQNWALGPAIARKVKESWRWAVGSRTRLDFHVDSAGESVSPLLLKLSFKNGAGIPGQAVVVRLNGREVRRFSTQEIDASVQINAEIVMDVKKGSNTLEFVYQDWNHGKKDYAAHDPRPLAIVITRLSLHATH